MFSLGDIFDIKHGYRCVQLKPPSKTESLCIFQEMKFLGDTVNQRNKISGTYYFILLKITRLLLPELSHDFDRNVTVDATF